MTRDEARADFLRLMIPQLKSQGYTMISDAYTAELCTLEGHQHGEEGDDCVYCGADLTCPDCHENPCHPECVSGGGL